MLKRKKRLRVITKKDGKLDRKTRLAQALRGIKKTNISPIGMAY